MRQLAKKLWHLLFSVMPFIIVGGLLSAALFIKPKAAGKSIEPPAIDRRDHFYGIAVPERGVIWAAGNDGKVVRSEDGGNSWKIQHTPVRQHLQDIAEWDAQRAVAVGNQAVVIVTRDRGKTWKEVQVPRSQVANKMIRVKTYPGGIAWSVGEMGAVLYTRDYGETWERRTNEEDVGWFDVAFADERNGWVVGEFGRMLRTTDGGTTWKSVKIPVQSSLMAIAFRDRMNGVAVGLEGVVLATNNGGNTWHQANKVTANHLLDVAWDGQSWRAVGGKGVLVTGDTGGASWKAGLLSDRDLAWHTRANSRFGSLYVSGASMGVLQNGSWNVFRSKAGG